MNLNTVREKLVNRVFDGFKDNDKIKQAYLTNGAKRFTEYLSDTHCYPLEVLCFTDVSEHYNSIFSDKEMVGLTDEHRAELAVLDELDNRQARENFGKQIADKLIAYFEQS